MVFMAMELLLQEAGNTVSIGGIGETVFQTIVGNWGFLAVGIGFIIAAVLIFWFLKHIIVNTVLGLIAWAIIAFALKISLPFWPTLIVTVIFGLAGIGAMIVLAFLGIV